MNYKYYLPIFVLGLVLVFYSCYTDDLEVGGYRVLLGHLGGSDYIGIKSNEQFPIVDLRVTINGRFRYYFREPLLPGRTKIIYTSDLIDEQGISLRRTGQLPRTMMLSGYLVEKDGSRIHKSYYSGWE